MGRSAHAERPYFDCRIFSVLFILNRPYNRAPNQSAFKALFCALTNVIARRDRHLI